MKDKSLFGSKPQKNVCMLLFWYERDGCNKPHVYNQILCFSLWFILTETWLFLDFSNSTFGLPSKFVCVMNFHVKKLSLMEIGFIASCRFRKKCRHLMKYYLRDFTIFAFSNESNFCQTEWSELLAWKTKALGILR